MSYLELRLLPNILLDRSGFVPYFLF
jgi:hypothetical protein